MTPLWHRSITVFTFAWLPLPAATAETTPKAAQAAPVLEPLATGGLLNMLLGLIVVLMLIVGLAWMLRRSGALQGGAGTLRVLGGLSMGARERVVLVQVGDTQLLLGVAPGRVQTLHVLTEPVVIGETGRSGSGGFAASLSAALKRGKAS